MATLNHYTPEERKNQAARLGKIFDLPDAGAKISQDGWGMESSGDGALLKVELVTFISLDEANKLMNAEPVDGDG